MKYFTNTLFGCTARTLCVASLFIYAHSSFAQKQETQAAYGQIHFLNSKGEEKCTLPIPEDEAIYDFSSGSEYCENNMVATFWLNNIPSATLIQFYEKETCSDAQTPDNYYFKLKTVNQPTDWSQLPNPPATMNIDQLRHLKKGKLIPDKNVRVEDAWVGSNYSADNLDERLSCVYIKRSQPVK